jgi:hypothetical protein
MRAIHHHDPDTFHYVAFRMPNSHAAFCPRAGAFDSPRAQGHGRDRDDAHGGRGALRAGGQADCCRKLMFPTIWNGSRDDTTRIALASSHDGKVWHWMPGGDLLRTPPFGRWDGGCIWATPNAVSNVSVLQRRCPGFRGSLERRSRAVWRLAGSGLLHKCAGRSSGERQLRSILSYFALPSTCRYNVVRRHGR